MPTGALTVTLPPVTVLAPSKVTTGVFVPGWYGTGSAYADAIIADGPSNYWRLGELTGNSLDAVGGKHGVVSGALMRGVSGPVGDAGMWYGGTTGKVVATGTVVLPQTYTVEVWCSPVVSAQRPVFSGRPTLGAPYFGTTAGPKVFVFIGASIQSVANLSIVTWSHVVAVFEPLAVTFYINGVFDSTWALAARATANCTALGLGWDTSNGASWLGGLDDVALYQFALTPAQIAAHYALRNPVPLSSVLLNATGVVVDPPVPTNETFAWLF